MSGCPANEVAPDGSYSESWPAYALAYYAAQAISAGLPDDGWGAAERVFRVYQRDGSLWDTPLEWAGAGNESPQWGRWYMSNPASWYLLLATSGIRLDLVHSALVLEPSWPAGWGDTLKALPVFLPGLEFRVSAERGLQHWSVSLGVKRIHLKPLVLDRLVSRLPRGIDPSTVQVTLSGSFAGDVTVEPDGRVIVAGPITLAKAGDGIELRARSDS